MKMILRVLANQGSFESKAKLSKVEVFILTWEYGVRTWSVPVSGTHLGRVGICQWLYSVYSAVQWLYCTVQSGIFAGVSVLCWQCTVLALGSQERNHCRELMSIKTHKLLTAGCLESWLTHFNGWACKKESSSGWLLSSLKSLRGSARPVTASQTKIIERTGEGKLKVVVRKTLREKLSSEFPMSQ